MKRFLTAVVVLFAFASVSEACPRLRKKAPATACQTVAAPAASYQTVAQARPVVSAQPVFRTVSGSSCPNGLCPVPGSTRSVIIAK